MIRERIGCFSSVFTVEMDVKTGEFGLINGSVLRTVSISLGGAERLKAFEGEISWARSDIFKDCGKLENKLQAAWLRYIDDH